MLVSAFTALPRVKLATEFKNPESRGIGYKIDQAFRCVCEFFPRSLLQCEISQFDIAVQKSGILLQRLAERFLSFHKTVLLYLSASQFDPRQGKVQILLNRALEVRRRCRPLSPFRQRTPFLERPLLDVFHRHQ